MQVPKIGVCPSFSGLKSIYCNASSTPEGDYYSYEFVHYYPFKDETEAEIQKVIKSEPEEHFYIQRVGLGTEIDMTKGFTLEKRLEFTKAEYEMYKGAERPAGYVLSKSELMIKKFLTDNRLYSHMHTNDFRELYPTFGQKIKKFFNKIFKPKRIVI